MPRPAPVPAPSAPRPYEDACSAGRGAICRLSNRSASLISGGEATEPSAMCRGALDLAAGRRRSIARMEPPSDSQRAIGSDGMGTSRPDSANSTTGTARLVFVRTTMSNLAVAYAPTTGSYPVASSFVLATSGGRLSDRGHDQHGPASVLGDAVGNRAEHEGLEFRESAGAEHDHAGVMPIAGGEDRMRRTLIRGLQDLGRRDESCDRRDARALLGSAWAAARKASSS
jgi:hypothetical protein